MMRDETSATKGRGLRRDKALISRLMQLVGEISARHSPRSAAGGVGSLFADALAELSIGMGRRSKYQLVSCPWSGTKTLQQASLGQTDQGVLHRSAHQPGFRHKISHLEAPFRG